MGSAVSCGGACELPQWAVNVTKTSIRAESPCHDHALRRRKRIIKTITGQRRRRETKETEKDRDCDKDNEKGTEETIFGPYAYFGHIHGPLR